MNDLYNLRQLPQHHDTETANLVCQRFHDFMEAYEEKKPHFEIHYEVPEGLETKLAATKVLERLPTVTSVSSYPNRT